MLTACYDTSPQVWFVNDCGVDIEIVSFQEVVPDEEFGDEHPWTRIAVEEEVHDDYDVGISFFVWARPVGSTTIPEWQAFLFDDLPDRPGNEEDRQLILEGSACNVS